MQVAYKHMVTLTQIAPGWDGVRGILVRNGQLTEEAMAGDGWPAAESGLKARLDSVEFWLARFAPDMVKFSVQEKITEEAGGTLDDEKKGRLRSLRDAMEGIEWTPEAIHTCIHDTATAAGVKANKLFETLYRIFLGQKKGPRMGYFLASLGREFVLGRIGAGAA